MVVIVRGTILRPRCTVNRDAAAAADAFQSSLKNRTEIKMTFCKEIAAAGGKKRKTTRYSLLLSLICGYTSYRMV